jgi:SAM-dependent methyltransferase
MPPTSPNPHGRTAAVHSGRLTGERPQQGVTPDSLLALHDAGYAAVLEHLGPGRVLDVGCGEGFESVTFAGPGRQVVGVDYSVDAAIAARVRFGAAGLPTACMDALELGLGGRTFDWVCSSHVIEHFHDPDVHAAEVARVVTLGGTAFFLTPNGPADFENPFHVHLFERTGLSELLGRHFEQVWVGGLDAVARVKEDLAARRAKADRILALDFLDLRHRVPRRWYVAAYTRLLPLAYKLLARGGSGGSSGITSAEFFVTEEVDETTLVLFAIARAPREIGSAGSAGSVEGEG